MKLDGSLLRKNMKSQKCVRGFIGSLIIMCKARLRTSAKRIKFTLLRLSSEGLQDLFSKSLPAAS
jgi:hypothetical protein